MYVYIHVYIHMYNLLVQQLVKHEEVLVSPLHAQRRLHPLQRDRGFDDVDDVLVARHVAL